MQEAGLTLELSRDLDYDGVAAALTEALKKAGQAEALGLDDPSKLRFTAQQAGTLCMSLILRVCLMPRFCGSTLRIAQRCIGCFDLCGFSDSPCHCRVHECTTLLSNLRGFLGRTCCRECLLMLLKADC